MNLTLEQLLQKEELAKAKKSQPTESIVFIYRRIAELYKQSNDLQKESEYLNKASEIEATLKK
jgi:hypothetical protein